MEPSEAPKSRAVTAGPQKRKPVGNPVQGLTNATQAAGRPWWFDGFSVAWTCVQVIYMPVKIVGDIANALVALIFLAMFAAIGLYFGGYIPNEVLVPLLGQIGDRILNLVQSSGLIQ